MIDINVYIQKIRELGLTDEQIRSILLEKGWTTEQFGNHLPSMASRGFFRSLFWPSLLSIFIFTIFPYVLFAENYQYGKIIFSLASILVLIPIYTVPSLVFYKHNYSLRGFFKSLTIPIVSGLIGIIPGQIVGPYNLIGRIIADLPFSMGAPYLLLINIITIIATLACVMIVNLIASIFFWNRVRRARKTFDELNSQ